MSKKKLSNLPWDTFTWKDLQQIIVLEEDSEKEEEEKKEEQTYIFHPETSDEIASKAEKDITWKKICFSTAQATFFANSKNEWYAGEAISDGNCGPDTIRIAIAREVARKPFFKQVRVGISISDLMQESTKIYNKKGILIGNEPRSQTVLKDKEFLYNEELVVFCLRFAHVVPILIVHTFEPYTSLKFKSKKPLPKNASKEDLAALEIAKKEYEQDVTRKYKSFFIPSELYQKYIPLILQEKKPLKYVVFKNIGNYHWVPWGVKSRLTDEFITVFSQEDLPKELFQRFQADLEHMKTFFEEAQV